MELLMINFQEAILVNLLLRLINFLRNTHKKLVSNSQKIEIVEEKLSNQLESYRLNSWMNSLLIQREKLMLLNKKYWGNLRRNE